MKITVKENEPLATHCPKCGGVLWLEEGGYTRRWRMSPGSDQPSVLRPTAGEEGFDYEGGSGQYELVCGTNPGIHRFEVEADDINTNLVWG